MNSQDIAKELHNALMIKENLEAKTRECNKFIFEKTAKLVEQMEEDDIDKITINGIDYKPVVEEDYSLDADASKWDECDDWFNWLRENGYGDIIKSKDSVHAQTRKAFLKSLKDEGKELPKFIKVSHWETIKYNKSAIKKLSEANRNAK